MTMDDCNLNLNEEAVAASTAAATAAAAAAAATPGEGRANDATSESGAPAGEGGGGGGVDVYVAAMIGDESDVRKYIAEGGDVDKADEDDGSTPLFAAAFWAHDEVARILIRAGCNVDKQRSDGATALHVACKNYQPSLVSILLQAGASTSIQDDIIGDTPLHWAHRSKAEECIDLLNKGGANGELLNHQGKTPLQVHGTSVDVVDDGEEESAMEENDEGDGEENVGGALENPGTVVLDDCCAHSARQNQMPSQYLPSAILKVLRIANHDKDSGCVHLLVSINDPADASNPLGGSCLPLKTELSLQIRARASTMVSPLRATLVWTGKGTESVPLACLVPQQSDGDLDTDLWIDVYVGCICICSMHLESLKNMDVGYEKEMKFSRVIFMCFSQKDDAFIQPSLCAVREVHGVRVLCCDESSSGETEARIRDSERFQICWSESAKADGRVSDQVKFASKLARNRLVSIHAICWDMLAADRSLKIEEDFRIDLHRNLDFLNAAFETNLELESSTSSSSQQPTYADLIHELQKEAHLASGGKIPCLPWLSPDPSVPFPSSAPPAAARSGNWLGGPLRIQFLCSETLVPGTPKGFHVRLADGWKESLIPVLLSTAKVLRLALSQGQPSSFDASSLLIGNVASSDLVKKKESEGAGAAAATVSNEFVVWLDVLERDLREAGGIGKESDPTRLHDDEASRKRVLGYSLLTQIIESYDGLLGTCGLSEKAGAWIRCGEEAQAQEDEVRVSAGAVSASSASVAG